MKHWLDQGHQAGELLQILSFSSLLCTCNDGINTKLTEPQSQLQIFQLMAENTSLPIGSAIGCVSLLAWASLREGTPETSLKTFRLGFK